MNHSPKMCRLGALAMLNCPLVSQDMLVRGISGVNAWGYGDGAGGAGGLGGMLSRVGADSMDRMGSFCTVGIL